MKILHFITTVNESSWAYQLHKELNKDANIESKIICFSNNTNDSEVFEVESIILKIIRKIKLYFERKSFSDIKFNLPFSSSLDGIGILKNEIIKNMILWADIINIHWVNADFMSIYDINELLDNDKKVVWRFYDSNPFTGGCHVRLGCEEYKNQCKNCPYVEKTIFPKKIFEKKAKLFSKRKLNIVVASQYIKDAARSSLIFNNSNFTVINNGIHSTTKLDKIQLRRKYSLKENEKYILFGATNLKLKNKGYEYLIEALKLLERQNIKFNLLTFGQEVSEIPNIQSPIIDLGFILDRNKLLEIYAVSDVFVGPSIEEGFGNVFLESLSVGTPCVIFDQTGTATDIIEHKINGYIAEQKNIEDLAYGLNYVLNHAHDMRENCLKRVEDKFLMSNIISQYKNYYESIQ